MFYNNLSAMPSLVFLKKQWANPGLFLFIFVIFLIQFQ